jgi:hypothetical protein
MRASVRVDVVFGSSFLKTCEIGLALPNEAPRAHNLNREGAFSGLPVQKDILEEF